MTVDRFTYEQLRSSRPGLSLPPWHRLRRVDRHRAKRMTVDELVSRRVAKMLSRTNETEDALQPQKPKRIVTPAGPAWRFMMQPFNRDNVL